MTEQLAGDREDWSELAGQRVRGVPDPAVSDFVPSPGQVPNLPSAGRGDS